MIDFDIKEITEEHVMGYWKIISKYPLSSDLSIFNENHELQITPEYFDAVNGVNARGNWSFIKEHDTIYHPQLKFFAEGVEVAHAIVTRLYSFYKNDLIFYKMTLYFTNGQELILEKETTMPLNFTTF